VLQTERTQYPERTVYQITEAGREADVAWLRDMLARPRNEFGQFPAALSFLMMLGPDGAAEVLEQRAEALRAERADIDADLQGEYEALPRIVLMDDEYKRAVTDAELAWVEGVLSDLRSGALTWTYAELAEVAARLAPEGEPVPPLQR
jgi:DNA-binding PadR family transcriptional regulator